MKTISTEVASNWLTRYKNEMTDDEFKLAELKLSEPKIFQVRNSPIIRQNTNKVI